ncbi:MAG: hypothetical protein M1835_007306 [Candelina submexicana]|nr:MAG: hypothetical protein M1835_007306 [Candelina submexicana]
MASLAPQWAHKQKEEDRRKRKGSLYQFRSCLSLKKRSEFFPPKPSFTEKDLHDLSGKVYMITGGISGIGPELARILYSKNAKVYITGRSSQSAEKAISDIKAHPTIDTDPTTGSLVFLEFDLTDLASIRPAVDSFLRQETVLHSVWYKAGVMNPPKGSKTVQGYELQTVWVSSIDHDMYGPRNGGINWGDINNEEGKMSVMECYGQSKAAVIMLSYETGKRLLS